MNDKWFSITEKKWFSIEEIDSLLKEVSSIKNHKIIIGTDSLKRNSQFIFTTAICIDCENSNYHRRYFYKRVKYKNDKFYDLCVRLTKETSMSIDISNFIKKNDFYNIEIHADINLNKKHESQIYSNMLKGYINGCGFSCILKPDSYAASSVADRHTRKK